MPGRGEELLMYKSSRPVERLRRARSRTGRADVDRSLSLRKAHLRSEFQVSV